MFEKFSFEKYAFHLNSVSCFQKVKQVSFIYWLLIFTPTIAVFEFTHIHKILIMPPYLVCQGLSGNGVPLYPVWSYSHKILWIITTLNLISQNIIKKTSCIKSKRLIHRLKRNISHNWLHKLDNNDSHSKHRDFIKIFRKIKKQLLGLKTMVDILTKWRKTVTKDYTRCKIRHFLHKCRFSEPMCANVPPVCASETFAVFQLRVRFIPWLNFPPRYGF